ncbi:hypothetical protein [Streptomyces sp. CNQ085]|uniref:hypothetical protein n=1 Tax=Streptomyces sp. CNQ085 TaxID=2886944 RepID=UPI001F50B8BC|nr:hypothetical protein [Streptomyces sp. CNQ085]MCI0385426.1 hypothetical protein [Streptomyces sp. CNQ085]
MDSLDYRAKAEELLRKAPSEPKEVHDRYVARAAVWAQLAQTAATTETAEKEDAR